MSAGRIYVGCAGWSLPGAQAHAFAGDGSHLERYARVLPAAEINSSFHRPHRASTYARWRQSVPADFRFSVKLPRAITHDAGLAVTREAIEAFLGPVGELGERLGALLVQLPPALVFAQDLVEAFFGALRAATPVALVCEPRHPSWFGTEADALLARHRVSFVRADPPPAGVPPPPGWVRRVYVRLHGSPRRYDSAYEDEFLRQGAAELRALAAQGVEAWCIFDNTAHGEAVPNALRLAELLREPA